MAMLTVGEALTQILDRIQPLTAEQVSLLDAHHRVLAETLIANRQLPAWDNSAMDGYALRSSDVTDDHTPLPIFATIPAGQPLLEPVPEGMCARIFTGAPMPVGTDTVMIQENAIKDESAGTVSFIRAAKHGENVRKQGSDVQIGQEVLSNGRVLSAGDIGFAAAQGRSTLKVIRKPSVSIFSTGSELIDVDAGLPAVGQIVNSNVWSLAAAVKAAGGVPNILPIVPDNYEHTLQSLRAATHSDVVISCGGMSVGDYDFMRDALKAITKDGFQFWKVAIKPGKPLGFGQVGRCSIFGLPGNPASASVTFELFVRPAIRKLQGYESDQSLIKARTVHPLPKGIRRQNYLRATAYKDSDGVLWVDASRNQSSGALSSTASVDALVVIKPNSDPIKAKDWVNVLMLSS